MFDKDFNSLAQRERSNLAVEDVTLSWQPSECCRWPSFWDKLLCHSPHLLFLSTFAPSSVSSSLFFLLSTIIPSFVLLSSICASISLFWVPSDCPTPPLICQAANLTPASECVVCVFFCFFFFNIFLLIQTWRFLTIKWRAKNLRSPYVFPPKCLPSAPLVQLNL